MEIIHDILKQKFYIGIDNQECHLEYAKDNNVINLIHTFVPHNLRGKGIAGELVKATLTYAQENSIKVIPSCSYVAAYIQRHKEYEPLVVT